MASGLEGTSPFLMLVDDDEDELEEVVHKEGSAASLFGNCGLISVLFETPSGFAIFAYDAVKLTKPDALKHIWADFVNLPKVFWMKAFKTFEGCAINKDYVSPELSLMIQKYVVNEQTLAVGNDDYKNVIEKCLEIRCVCSPVVQELMWGLRIQLWRFLRPGENSGMTNDDRFPMSEGMIFLLKSHGLNINPHMMVTKQTIELAHVVYECDRCVNKYDSFLRLAAQHLVKISRIYTHRWDLLKLATAFKMIFDPQVEIPDAQRLFSERQLKRLMKHAPRYKNKISKDRCLKAYKEIYSARKRRLKAAKVLLSLVKQAEKTYEDEQAGRAASDPEISRDTKKICRGLGPVMIDELTECHTIVSEKCKKIQVPPTLSTVDALERYTQIFSHPLNMTNRPGILPVDTHPSKIIRIWQGSEDENYSCVYPLKDHTAEVEAVTVHASQKYFVTTASQKYFVTTSRDNSWRFYDISTGSCLAQAGEPSGQEGYTSAVFHPGGRILGTGTTDGAVKIWDVKSQGHKHERTPYQSMLCHSLKMSAGLDVVKIGIFGHAGQTCQTRVVLTLLVNQSERMRQATVLGQYGEEISAAAKTVKCKFCNVTRSGGIYRFKHHLAGTKFHAEPCTKVPTEVREKFLKLLGHQAEANDAKKRQLIAIEEQEEARTSQDQEQESQKCKQKVMDHFVKRRKTFQGTMNQQYKKEEREEVCAQICRFLCTSAIPFNVVRNPEFGKMVQMIGKFGNGLKPPSYHEARVVFLEKEVQKMVNVISEYKDEWKKTGCTIMSDGWTDIKRSLCNFLVNSPKGTVFLYSIDTSEISKTAEKVFEMLDEIVERVGEENVIQVVTDNASNYKAAGDLLMAKRKTLYWTPCAAHCIDLMLEDFEKKIKMHSTTITKGRKITTFIYSRTMLISWLREFTEGKDLVRPAITRFATAYLTLSCLEENKGALINMFSSTKWKASRFASLIDGKKVQEIVMDSRGFWPNVVACLKAAMPLVRVLRMVDSDEKPAMPFIYAEMDRAKEMIRDNFNKVKKSYIPVWNIINERWETQLQRPLHSAGSFRNGVCSSNQIKEITS